MQKELSDLLQNKRVALKYKLDKGEIFQAEGAQCSEAQTHVGEY